MAAVRTEKFFQGYEKKDLVPTLPAAELPGPKKMYLFRIKGSWEPKTRKVLLPSYQVQVNMEVPQN